MTPRCASRALLTVLVHSAIACGESAGPSAQIDVCGRGDRDSLASDLAGGKLALTFRSADGQVLLLREAPGDRPETLPIELPAGTTLIEIEGLSSTGDSVARGSGAVLGDAACVCLARNQDFEFMCDEVSCVQDEGRCSFFDPRDPEPCQLIGPERTVIDNNSSCFQVGGTPAFLRSENVGFGGSLRWTNTTSEASVDNFGRWDLHFESAGMYRVEAFTAPEFGVATNARYQVAHASHLSEVIVDQSASDTWSLLGDFEFDAGGVQFVFLGDNAGPPVGVHLAFDAIRLTPVAP